MSDRSKSWDESWLGAQQALWQGRFPLASPAAGDEGETRQASPLEEQFKDLRDTWQASVAKWSDFAREASADVPGHADQLREMFAPASWGNGSDVLDAGLRRVLEGPRYALLWDLDRKLLELQQLTLRRDKDVAVYQAVVGKAWSLAFERFAKAVDSGPESLGKRTWRSLVDQWLAVANETLTEVYRTDEFLEAQRSMLRSASDRHLQERRIAEAWSEAMHIPTRSEVDELQRHVLELRRELRLMRRTAAATAAAPHSPGRRKAAPRRARS